MALCESVSREAAGGGDESAARVGDVKIDQPVKRHKWQISFLTARDFHKTVTGWAGGALKMQFSCQYKLFRL